MEGFFFYWLFWLGWIITTFLYPKHKPERLPLSAWLLSVIFLADVSFAFLELKWNGAGLFILITTYMYITRYERKRLLYFLLSAFIIMLVTVCFFFLELYDPVWLVLERKWLLAIFVVYSALLLHSDPADRILAILFGMIHGEIFYAFILKEFLFSYPISSLAFLDALAAACAIVLAWNSLEIIAAYLNKYFQTLEKEKQKYHE